MGLETLYQWTGSLLCGRNITATFTREIMKWFVTNCCMQRGTFKHMGMQYSHQQTFTNLSSFFRRLLLCKQSFSTWMNTLYVGTCHISRIGPFHPVVVHPLSSHHTAPCTVPDCNFLWS